MGIRLEYEMSIIAGDEEKAFKRLLREKLTNNKKDLVDEIFINYKIAEYYHSKDNELKHYYMTELEKIFLKPKNRQVYKFDYAMYLNLYTDMYEKELDTESKFKILKVACNIFKELGNKYFYTKAIDKIINIDKAEELESLSAVHT